MSILFGPDSKGVFSIVFDDSVTKDHRLGTKLFKSINSQLDTILQHGGDPGNPKREGKPTAVVITGWSPDNSENNEKFLKDKKDGKLKESKFFSNGFDFEHLGNNMETAFEDLHKLCLRLIKFPVPTIACLNGHCYAGAVFLALSCDYRVMNEENGTLCLNELQDQEMFASFRGEQHMTFPFTDNMMTVVNSKCSFDAKNRLLLGAEQISGAEAKRIGLVDFTAKGGVGCFELAKKLAGSHAKKGRNHALYRVAKERLLGSANLKILDDVKYRDPRVSSKL